MPPADEVRRAETRAWIARAEEDLRHAQHDLAEVDFLPDICWHAQQATEKLLKAYLVHEAVAFRFVHDIDYLLDQVAKVNPQLAQALRETAELTPYAVETRYPAQAPPVTLGEARRAVQLADKAHAAVIAALQGDRDGTHL